MITNNNAVSEVTISSSSSPEEHGFVINKTQEFLKSKGFGWLMEVDSSSDSKENILGGESVEQPSILEELDIDVAEIIFKVKRVIVPFGKFSSEDLEKLREPDFWGPFFIILAYAFLVELTYLQLKVITWMYLIWFIGSALLFALGRLFTPANIEEARSLKKLKMNQEGFQPIGTSDNAQFPSSDNDAPQISEEEQKIIDVHYGQVMSFVGYSLIPHVAILVVLLLFRLIFDPILFSLVSLILNLCSIAWSTVSCVYLFTADNYYLEKKKKLLIVPILLLYLYFFSMQSGV
ncbi:predicted protein [Naegleria gruberi]|uniref:Predicted protein n=1 Tax=Naegleria gruberi TaxID=5762 RepID=D2VRA3_NAEGR|nr:uncharacterized protein NAEGRDRAFT_71516 [Naegleria gruberi]EFC40570.1 predicted protein [Naegleria gruberi]|eukprot:XP_002673314.1 predicted protein [Naegleria gruberi strain NEG-M]